MPRRTKIRKTGKGKGKKYTRSNRKNKSRRYGRYRGGCEKCNSGAEPSGASLWSSSGPMVRGGSEQISEDIYNYKTDPYFYSSS